MGISRAGPKKNPGQAAPSGLDAKGRRTDPGRDQAESGRSAGCAWLSGTMIGRYLSLDGDSMD